ncbi:MAG: 4Fe-4S binding protein [Promethearchaeota archaeon]
MYPRVKEIQTDKFNEVILNFYTENYTIAIDKEKCIGCGFCIKVCPNNAIPARNLEGKVRVKTEDLVPDTPNVLKCSYCGTCMFMCPLTAISLKYNEKLINKDDLGIVKNKVVPRLDYKSIKSKKSKKIINVYFDGKISIDWDKCIKCMSCVDVCPQEALIKSKSQSDNGSKKTRVSFNEEKCIKCGTCVRACSVKAISLEDRSLHFSGDFKMRFWESLLKRIKT